MDCPKCGYVMDPFEAECPRCARMGDKATATAAPPPPPAKDQEVLDTIDKMSPKLQTRMVQQAPIRYVPPLGWPLSVLLWLDVGLNGFLLIFLTISVILAQSAAESQSQSSAIGGLGFIIAAVPGINLAAAIAMLRFKQWGFWVFSFFNIGPIAMALMLGMKLTVSNVITIAPAIAIFILALTKWDEFE